MGLHHGIVAATATGVELLTELQRHTGEWLLGEAVDSPYEAEPRAVSGGWEMAIGERDGLAFLLDSSLRVSDAPDMIASMSSVLGTVAACGAETVSGTYWLAVARDGVPLRFVFVSRAGMRRGMAVGEPLASEVGQSIEDLDGGALLAAMASVGLDPTRWLAAGPAWCLRYDGSRFPEDGPIEKMRAAHYRRYQRPDDEWLSEITAVEAHPHDV
jgi:hypothetical protein